MRFIDPSKFTILSLLIVVAVMIATGVTGSSFYRREIIKGESDLIYDLVRAFVLEQQTEDMLSSSDLQHYSESLARTHFEHSFGPFTTLPGFARIKVFNTDQTIVWSDEPALIGTKLDRNKQDLALAIAGEVRAVFDAEQNADPIEALPQRPLVEFYVPWTLSAPGNDASPVTGVVSIYRSAREMNETIQRGLLLLWLVTGFGGLILYAILYRLFRSVFNSRRDIETRFANLSAEHELIIQIQKLSAMGQMVSEIAHQLNNPLVGVINLAELAEREIDDKARVKELLREVQNAGKHCRDFVQRVLRLSQLRRNESQLTDMNELVRDTIVFFQQSLGGHPAVTLEAPAEPVSLEVDPELIRHALFNLIHNATQADPEGPVVVSLARDERKGKVGYCLTVSDSGPGFRPELIDELFAPFFTTRPGGTGLGLSIAQHIAILHGGTISCENRPEGGARFTIWIPAARGNA